MKSKKKPYYKNILRILKDLNQTYPSYGIGRHLSTALSDYGDLWGVSDKEIEFALSKYREQLACDNIVHIHDQYEIDKIIEDGLNLNIEIDEI